MSESLQQEINKNFKNNTDDPAVVSAMDLMFKSELVRNDKENEWSAIQDLFESGFSVSDPSGTRKIESSLLFHAVRRTVEKMKPLDAQLHATGVDEDSEFITTQGVGTVLEEGGFVKALRDDFGVFYRMLLFGDAFVRVGADTDNKYPIKFQNTSLLNVYVDPYANNMRSPTSEKDADELVAIYKYSWDDAVKIYPKIAEVATSGRITRINELEELDETIEQQLQTRDREIEVAHYYNLSSKNYTVFAGVANSIIEQHEGDDYPFMKDKKPFIPFLRFRCFPASEGFYSNGIGHALYRLAVISRQLNNMALTYGEQNISPIRMINVPSGQQRNFFNRLVSAQRSQAEGKQGFIVNEYELSDPNAGRINMDSFRSDPISSEWERLFNAIDLEIKRMGINIDAADRGGSITATQILAEEETQNSFVRQIMEDNAGEYKFAWELTIEMIKEFISKKDKTPINMLSTVMVDGKEERLDGFTMGQLSSELKENDYFVKINSRSGFIPSNIMQQVQINRTLAVTQPGTPAFAKLSLKLARLNGQDLKSEDLQAQQSGPSGIEGQESIPTETGDLSLDQVIQ